MVRVMRAEWLKIRRPSFLAGALGAVTFFTVLATFGRFRMASLAVRVAERQRLAESQGATAGGSGGGGAGFGGRGASPGRVAQAEGLLADLREPGGWLVGVSSTGRLIGFVALVVFALAIGHEYRYGTLRSALSIEPRRFHLLLGKLTMLSGVVALTIVCAFIAAFGVAFMMAGSVNVDTGPWLRSAPEAAGVFANVWLSSLAWGLAGACLAIVFKSNAPAIGIGVIYGMLGEPIIGLVANALEADGVARWLPANVLGALAGGGTEAISYALALAIGAAYIVVLGTASTLLVQRRDVTV